MTIDYKSLNILIVDDDLAIQKLLGLYLEAQYGKVYYASNGKEGLERLEEFKDISLVLSDINMPVCDGIAFIQQTREKKISVPFIFFTGFGSHSLMVQALQYGAFDFLEKPEIDYVNESIQRGILSNFKTEEEQEFDFMCEFKKMTDRNGTEN